MPVLDFIRKHAYSSFVSYLVIIYAMDSISLAHLEIDEIQMKFCERKIFDTKTWYQNINIKLTWRRRRTYDRDAFAAKNKTFPKSIWIRRCSAHCCSTKKCVCFVFKFVYSCCILEMETYSCFTRRETNSTERNSADGR